MLAAPFGTSNLLPVPLVAAGRRPADGGRRGRADRLAGKLTRCPDVSPDAGRSAGRRRPGRAVRRAGHQCGGDQNPATDLVERAAREDRQRRVPAGLQAHLAGGFAVQVDQQKANGNQGGKIEKYFARC